MRGGLVIRHAFFPYENILRHLILVKCKFGALDLALRPEPEILLIDCFIKLLFIKLHITILTPCKSSSKNRAHFSLVYWSDSLKVACLGF